MHVLIKLWISLCPEFLKRLPMLHLTLKIRGGIMCSIFLGLSHA